ncbi:MAG: DUF2281 domain-containing protein [Cyanobacteria bacterium P01_G01_bin.54]
MAIAQSTTLKAQIITALDSLSLEQLQTVLAHVQQLQPEKITIVAEAEHPDVESTDYSDHVWQAYLASKRERAEVYRRLADS